MQNRRTFMKLGAVAGAFACVAGSASAAETKPPELFTLNGLSDASGAAAWNGQIIVAGDERNELLFYEPGKPDPVRRLNLDPLFPPPGRKAERDIEGMAIKNGVLWLIGSHSENKKGRPCLSRRFFGAIRLSDFSAIGSCALYEVAGLNIEGLAIQADGSALIGFRKPAGRIDRLMNPEGVLRGEKPKLGEVPQALRKFKGAVRDLCAAADGKILTLATGNRLAKDGVEIALDVPSDFNAEAVAEDPQLKRLYILSDDGTLVKGGMENKKLPPARQTFRMAAIPE